MDKKIIETINRYLGETINEAVALQKVLDLIFNMFSDSNDFEKYFNKRVGAFEDVPVDLILKHSKGKLTLNDIKKAAENFDSMEHTPNSFVFDANKVTLSDIRW